MKGLLAKDLALLLQRKKTFIILFIWVIFMVFTTDGSFAIGFMAVITSFFAISSVSYDEYDNCYPFLMTLPINGRIYAREKYVFGLLCGVIAWVISVVITIAVEIAQGNSGAILEDIAQAVIFIPIFMLLIDVTLPVNLKFGSERGRIIVFIIWGAVFAGIFAISKTIDTNIVVEDDAPMGIGIIAVTFLIAIVLTIVSMIISTKIMEKKEY